MPTPVNRVPTNFSLTGVQVGNPVSSAHVLRWAEECSFNGGYNVQSILALNLKPRAAARTQLEALGAYSVPLSTTGVRGPRSWPWWCPSRPGQWTPRPP